MQATEQVAWAFLQTSGSLAQVGSIIMICNANVYLLCVPVNVRVISLLSSTSYSSQLPKYVPDLPLYISWLSPFHLATFALMMIEN